MFLQNSATSLPSFSMPSVLTALQLRLCFDFLLWTSLPEGLMKPLDSRFSNPNSHLIQYLWWLKRCVVRVVFFSTKHAYNSWWKKFPHELIWRITQSFLGFSCRVSSTNSTISGDLANRNGTVIHHHPPLYATIEFEHFLFIRTFCCQHQLQNRLVSYFSLNIVSALRLPKKFGPRFHINSNSSEISDSTVAGTLLPIIMEVENGYIWKETTIAGTHCWLPWSWEEV